MDYELLSAHILNDFKITKKHIGYSYISYGIHLMQSDKTCIEHITKTLYIDIAEKYETTNTNVERGIRATIEIIWKNNVYEASLLVKIFGDKYKYHRPTNTEFFELLFAYIESHDDNTINCPFFGCDHCVLSGEKVLKHEFH